LGQMIEVQRHKGGVGRWGDMQRGLQYQEEHLDYLRHFSKSTTQKK